MLGLDSCPAQKQGVHSRVVDGEAVLVMPEKGEIKVLNPLGTHIWSLLDGQHSLGKIAESIAAEYQVGLAEAQADTFQFVTDLTKHDLVNLNV